MNVPYEIAAKETEYNGVVFRSKLESLWAKSFDLHRLRWTYEPFVVGKWMPDFALDFTHRDDKFVFLCEVKPFVVKEQWFHYNEERYRAYVENGGVLIREDEPKHSAFSWHIGGRPKQYRIALLGMVEGACNMSVPSVEFDYGWGRLPYCTAPYNNRFKITKGLQ